MAEGVLSVLWKVNEAPQGPLTKPLLYPEPVHPARGGPRGSGFLVQGCRMGCEWVGVGGPESSSSLKATQWEVVG